MTKVRVAGFSISLDGFGAGPEQSLENPIGKRGHELHTWLFGTRMFRTMVGGDGGPGRSRSGLCTSFDGRIRRVHPRPQYVWADPRSVAGRELERLVGQQPALSHADLRADAPSTRSDRDGRWHHLHLRDQRYRGGVGSGETISQWARREDRRWRTIGGTSEYSVRRAGR